MLVYHNGKIYYPDSQVVLDELSEGQLVFLNNSLVKVVKLCKNGKVKVEIHQHHMYFKHHFSTIRVTANDLVVAKELDPNESIARFHIESTEFYIKQMKQRLEQYLKQ